MIQLIQILSHLSCFGVRFRFTLLLFLLREMGVGWGGVGGIQTQNLLTMTPCGGAPAHHLPFSLLFQVCKLFCALTCLNLLVPNEVFLWAAIRDDIWVSDNPLARLRWCSWMDDNKTGAEPITPERQTAGTCNHTALQNEIHYKSFDDLQDWSFSGL